MWRVWKLEVTNVSRIVSLGGSIRRILRISEPPGRSRFRVAKKTYEAGWVRLFGDWGLEVTNVSRIVGLGGSIRRILQGSEAPGGPDSCGAG